MVQNYDIECKKVTPLVQGRYFCSNCTMTINGETVKGFNMIIETGNNSLSETKTEEGKE